MTATYTFDVVATLDGYGSFVPGADWGGFWGKQGPEFLDRRFALYGAGQRMVLGANTFRQFVELLGEIEELDEANTLMRNLPTTVVSNTLEAPSTGRTRPSQAVTPSMSSPGSRRSPRCRCSRTAACR